MGERYTPEQKANFKQEILRLTREGMSKIKIAKELGISQNSVYIFGFGKTFGKGPGERKRKKYTKRAGQMVQTLVVPADNTEVIHAQGTSKVILVVGMPAQVAEVLKGIA